MNFYIPALNLLNEKQPTYLHPLTENFYAIDLSLCHPNINLDFDWSVCDDLHGSNHFPILIKETESSDDEQHCRWNLKKANWEAFTTLCQEQLTPEKFKTAEDMSAFTSALHDISEKCIPKSSTRSKRRNPWYNDECKTAVNKRKSALRKFNKNPSRENHMHSKLARAKARRTIKDAKSSSWRQYVNKLNSRTPVKKVWDMIRKVSGKNKKSECVHIKSSNGNMCYSTKNISNASGGNFQKNSSSSNYSQFQNIKVEKEREKLNFQSQNNEKYNLPFKLSELKNSLDKSHDTTAGPDDIHYQILKHLPSDALETLLNIMNEIWRTGKFPEDWHKAVIIPIPKPGKDKTEATNYRPIALTSCICKTMEGMINDRLVWFLESNNLISGNQAGFRKNYSTNDHLPSLYTRREKLSLQYTTKLAANPKNPAHNCVFNPKYERFYNNTLSAIKPLGLRILPLLELANISIKNVQPFSLPSKEQWTQNPPMVILDLHKNKKSEVDSQIFKTEFLEIKSAYKHYMSIYTDGSKQDEKVACDVISPNFTDSIRLPDNSSIFTAEAKAIDIALYHIRDQPEKQFIIYSDSLSVLRSLKNLDHRNPLIQQIFRKYNYLSSFKEIVFCWLPSHTNIRGNELADLEAKSALSLSITNLKIPHSDFKSNIHQYVMNKCQSVWEEQTGNKLHELKRDFNSKCSFLGYSRQIQTKITRCRIGHTRLTHSYLLTNEQPPFCISCNEPFTVKHFLITCTEFNYIRHRYFTAKTVKELFSDTSSDKIINFLKETNLFNKL